jgi:hypothetical protein
MSPEMPYFHRSRWPRVLRSIASTDRSRASPESSRPAEPLEAHRVLQVEVQVPQLDLAVGIGERDRPRHGAAVVVLLDQVARRGSLSA